jgi:hypothetical protein
MLEVALDHRIRFIWSQSHGWQSYCYIRVSSGSLKEAQLNMKEVRNRLQLSPRIAPTVPEGLGRGQFFYSRKKGGIIKLPFTWRTNWGGSVPCSKDFTTVSNKSCAEAVGAGVVYALGTTFRGRLSKVVEQLDVDALYSRRGEAQRVPADITLEDAKNAVKLIKALADVIGSAEQGEGGAAG